MSRHTAVAACLLAILCSTGFAETLDRADFEAVLVPIGLPHGVLIPGSHGSLWATELWVRNSSDTPIMFAHGVPWCPSPFCGPGMPIEIRPLQTERPYIRSGRQDSGMSGLFFVERSRSDDLFFSLRIRDVTRNAESAGTMIPIVREREFFGQRFELLNVPLAFGRINLRIYEAFASRSEVRVDLLPMNGEEPLASRVVTLPKPTSDDWEFPFFPSEAVVLDLAAWIDGRPDGLEAMRIRIEPQGEGRFWAFASITNDVTQQVTIVAPD